MWEKKEMISIIIWFILLSSGGVLCAAVWGKEYEEVLPITISSIVLFLFFFSIGGKLKIGVVFLFLLTVGIYIFSVYYLLRKKCYKDFYKSFFTPGFVVFLCFLVVACYLNVGKQAEFWDEFSHWVDIVKAMTMIDDLGTCPKADSTFLHYPPGMSLFQYLLQKLHVWTSNSVFSEWRVYVSYQIFVFSFMFPCFKFHWKKFSIIFLSVVGMFLSPLLFYGNFYTSVHMDPVLGILSGTGFVNIFFDKERDLFHSLRTLLTCSMLVLLKDAGILFAVFLAITYVMDTLQNGNPMKGAKKYFCILVSMLFVIGPKCLWSFHLFLSNVKSNTSSLNIKMLFDVLMNRDSTYRKTVLVNYYDALFSKEIRIGNIGISLNYVTLAILFLLVICVVVWYYEKRDVFYQRKAKVLLLGITVQFLVYLIGLFATYISNFTEYEATRLASFERYIGIVYLSTWVVLSFLSLRLLEEFMEVISYKYVLVFSFIVLLTAPIETVYKYLSRSSVQHSVSVRSPYNALSKKIMDVVPEESNIYLVAQETTGFDYWVLRFNIRPNHVNSMFTWSIGKPFYEGDIWSRSITPQEWKNELLNGYDYVALYKVNDYFLQNFSELFLNRAEIEENTVYWLNKESGLLEKRQPME